VPIDPGTAFDWFQRGSLLAVSALLVFGYLIPKPTHEDVKAQRDKAQAQRDEAIALMAEMKNVTREAVDVMKSLDGKHPARAHNGQGSGGD
jgi:hypothetical protein